MSAAYVVRPATVDDIGDLTAFRRAMFESMGVHDVARLTAMETAVSAYLHDALPGETYHGWVAEIDGRVVGSGGLVIQHLPPGPRNLDGRQGYILNVYTVPEWRDQGIATAIVQAMLDYLQEIGVPVATLHATDAGRPIYERLGFAPTNEMRLSLNGKH